MCEQTSLQLTPNCLMLKRLDAKLLHFAHVVSRGFWTSTRSTSDSIRMTSTRTRSLLVQMLATMEMMDNLHRDANAQPMTLRLHLLNFLSKRSHSRWSRMTPSAWPQLHQRTLLRSTLSSLAKLNLLHPCLFKNKFHMMINLCRSSSTSLSPVKNLLHYRQHLQRLPLPNNLH